MIPFRTRSARRANPRLSGAALILALLAATALSAGCGAVPAATATPAADRTLSVVASFYPVYVTVLQLTKDVPGVATTLLVPPSTGCLHDYSLTGGDMKTLSGADILVVNGSGMEGFLEDVAGGFPDLVVIEASRGVDALTDPTGAVDPHVWTSPPEAARQVRGTAEALAAADPAHADLYEANAVRYGARLDELDRRAREALAPYKGVGVLAGHSSFLYFAREYGFQVVGIFGLDDGQTVGSGELARMIDEAKAGKASLIVTDPQYPAVAGETVARETELPACVFDSVAVGALEGDAAMEDYLDRMSANVDRLLEALKTP